MSNTSTATQTRVKIKTPSMWRVLLHNDDFTPIEFVVELLRTVFNKETEEAIQIAQYVHERGKAQVGLYTKEVAQTKVSLAQQIAEEHQHPLLTTTEEA